MLELLILWPYISYQMEDGHKSGRTSDFVDVGHGGGVENGLT